MLTETEPTQTPLPVAARTLVQTSNRGVLSTITGDGFPYGSLTDFAPLPNGDALLFISRLAEHHRYLQDNPRASIFIPRSLDSADAIAQERVTIVGQVALISDRQSVASLYLKYHPQAAAYINFGDFEFYQLHVEKVRYIAGFGRMGWILEKGYHQAAIPADPTPPAM